MFRLTPFEINVWYSPIDDAELEELLATCALVLTAAAGSAIANRKTADLDEVKGKNFTEDLFGPS